MSSGVQSSLFFEYITSAKFLPQIGAVVVCDIFVIIVEFVRGSMKMGRFMIDFCRLKNSTSDLQQDASPLRFWLVRRTQNRANGLIENVLQTFLCQRRTLEIFDGTDFFRHAEALRIRDRSEFSVSELVQSLLIIPEVQLQTHLQRRARIKLCKNSKINRMTDEDHASAVATSRTQSEHCRNSHSFAWSTSRSHG